MKACARVPSLLGWGTRCRLLLLPPILLSLFLPADISDVASKITAGGLSPFSASGALDGPHARKSRALTAHRQKIELKTYL